MRIAFIGNVEFSRRALAKLIDMEAEVVGVLTRRNAPANSDHVDLSSLADGRGIPFAHQEDLDPEATAGWLESLHADVVFCFGWSRLLPRRILEATRLGVVGFHPSPLPRGRGRHPIVWALALGLPETGSSFFLMEEGADTGAILSQKRVEILPQDEAADLYDRICATALAQIEEFVPAMAKGEAHPRPQDHSQASSWRKRGKGDGRIDWRMSAASIANLVRALAPPYPGAHFETRDGLEPKVRRAVVLDSAADPFVEPGRILARSPAGDWLDVRCGDKAVRILPSDGHFPSDMGDWLP